MHQDPLTKSRHARLLYCDLCGKKCFSRKEAKRVAKVMRHRGITTIQVYRCRHCGRHHVGNRRRDP